MKFSFVFSYRNREIERVERCLNSLDKQINKDFEVCFVDYGSDKEYSDQIETLCEKYNFVNYIYNDTFGMPWNRSHALNTGLKLTIGEYIVFGDVDLIYPPNFIDYLNAIDLKNKITFGCFVLLPSEFDFELINFSDKMIEMYDSISGAGAINIIEKSKLIEINSFDEYYCYWGVEDRDLRDRLTKIGVTESFLPNQVFALHQWHPVTSNFYTSGFPLQWWEDMNLYFYRNKNNLIRNDKNWGYLYSKEDRTALKNDLSTISIDLNCGERAMGKNGKVAIIGQIYDALNTLRKSEKITFKYVREKHKSLFEEMPGMRVFSKFITDTETWKKYSDDYRKYKNRQLYFIPEEDLAYIFWRIIRTETQFDYSIDKTSEYISWTFALKNTHLN